MFADLQPADNVTTLMLLYFSQVCCVCLAITAHKTQQECLETGIANPQIALLKLQHNSHIAGTHWARHLLHHTLIVNTDMAQLEHRQMNFVMSIQCIVAVLLLIFAIKDAWC